MIVKCDGIGDYILFRNFLYFLKDSAKYKNHKIYLLANIGSKELATCLDSEVIDGFYWYSDGFFLKWHLVSLIFRLQALRPETLFYTNYSRKYIVDELMDSVNAKWKLAVDGDLTNENDAQKRKADDFYTHLISVNQGPAHEFLRNREIVEKLTGEKCLSPGLFIDKGFIQAVPDAGVVVFTSAGSADKKWPAAKFNELCSRLIADFTLRINVIGGDRDTADITEIKNGCSSRQISFHAHLSMMEVCGFIAGAKLLISGDTVAIHIAAALGVPAVCLAKGDLYGRFIPYPPAVPHDVRVIFPKGYLHNNGSYSSYSTYTIDDVAVKDVYEVVCEVLTVS